MSRITLHNTYRVWWKKVRAGDYGAHDDDAPRQRDTRGRTDAFCYRLRRNGDNEDTTGHRRRRATNGRRTADARASQ